MELTALREAIYEKIAEKIDMGDNRRLTICKLKELGTDRVSRLLPDKYQDFYNFLLTLE